MRRFEAFGVDRRSVLGAEAWWDAGLVVVAVLTLLAAAAAVFGIPGSRVAARHARWASSPAPS